MFLAKSIESMSNLELLRFIAQILWRHFGPYYLVVTDALTFDEVHLAPKYTNLGPDDDISTRTELLRGVYINTPFMSAAMDTVTGPKMAIALAKNGAVGVLHRNCSLEEQVNAVKQVKRHRKNMVTNPMTLSPETTISQAIEVFNDLEFGTIPIVDGKRTLLGLVSKSRVLDFQDEPDKKLVDMMTGFDDLYVAYKNTDIPTARAIMKQQGPKRLPIIESETDHTLVGLYFRKDLDTIDQFPNMSVDVQGGLLVGAAVGVGEEGFVRGCALVDAGADFLVIDVAQGHSQAVADVIQRIKAARNIPIMAGNVVTTKGAEFLIAAGADAIKVGVGPGAICTTREKTGNGKAQFTAIDHVRQATKKANIPLIADGGIKTTGDVVKALAAGANAVMMGSVFAGTDEAPGRTKHEDGIKYKEYRGMGSLEAMKDGNANDRYGVQAKSQAPLKKFKKVAEGVSGWVISKGPVQDVIDDFLNSLIQSMRNYQGARTITELQTDPEFTRIGPAGQVESGTRLLLK